jgi:hypothetical protein
MNSRTIEGTAEQDVESIVRKRKRLRRFNRIGSLINAVTYSLAGVGALAAAFLLQEYRLVLAIGGFLGLVVGIASFRYYRKLLRSPLDLPSVPSRPLIGAGILSFDYFDWERLSDFALQSGIELEPTKSERGLSKKRLGSVKGNAKVFEVSGGQEQTTSETQTFDIPHNPSSLLRNLVAALDREGMLVLGLDEIPTVGVDQSLDQADLQGSLYQAFQQRLHEIASSSGGSTAIPLDELLADADSIAHDVTTRLSIQSLARAKREQFSKILQGSMVLTESDWNVVDSGSEQYELVLSKLHSTQTDRTARSIDVPEDLSLKVVIDKTGVSSKGKLRFSASEIRAGVLGEVVKDSSVKENTLVVWPIAVFLRTPRQTQAVKSGGETAR